MSEAKADMRMPFPHCLGCGMLSLAMTFGLAMEPHCSSTCGVAMKGEDSWVSYLCFDAGSMARQSRNSLKLQGDQKLGSHPSASAAADSQRLLLQEHHKLQDCGLDSQPQCD